MNVFNVHQGELGIMVQEVIGQTPAEMREALRQCPVKCYPKKNLIWSAGDAIGLHLVVSGLICAEENSFDGKSVVTMLYGPLDFFGSPFGDAQAHLGMAYANTVVLRVPANNRAVKEQIAASSFYRRNLYAQLKFSQLRSSLLNMSVSGKISATLMYFKNMKFYASGNGVNISQAVLSSFVGCSRETLCRTIKSMAQSGILKKTGHTLIQVETEKRSAFNFC